MFFPFARRTPPSAPRLNADAKSQICELKPLGVPDLERSHAIFLDLLYAMKGSKLRVVKAVIRFFESTLMGCFFSCFRIKDDARRKTGSGSDFIVSEDGASLVWKKDLASDNLQQGHEADADLVDDSSDCCIQRNLKNESKVFNNSDTLSKIHEEIEEISSKVFSRTSNEDCLFSSMRSQAHQLHGMMNNLGEQSDPMHQNVAQLENNLGQPKRNEGSNCMLKEEKTVTNVLQFEGNHNVSHVCEQDSVSLDISPSYEDSRNESFDASPYPTPLSLIHEMQTPGTIYPVDWDNRRSGKRTRIRSEYVYPILKPVENIEQWVALRKDSILFAQPLDSFEQRMKMPKTGSTERKILPPGSTNQENVEPETPLLTVSSLSQCLKARPLNNEKGSMMHISNQQSFSVINFDADRPIIGAVGVHWNDVVPFSKSPKRWDGNGIPNTTNKYKEEQRVSWHATPFEQRLEKVLSDEKHMPQRKLMYREPMELEDQTLNCGDQF